MRAFSLLSIAMTALLSLAFMTIAAPTKAADKRVALVVGVAHYAHATTLAHTLDDARDVAASLKRLGFDVDLVLDPDRAALEAAVRRLGQKSAGTDASLFYYSGHALESQGVNWILPASANINSDRDLRFEALDLSVVLEQVEGLSHVSLIFLDACREDPFKQRLGGARDLARSGLASVNAATVSGTYIAFATAPGMVASDGTGPHSPFTASLLKFIETPGLEVRQLISKVGADVGEATDGKQVPWDSSSLKGDFYFKPANDSKGGDQVERAIKSGAPQVDLDALFWDSVRNSKDAADLNAYLAKFPQGAFVELARNRLAQLNSAPVANDFSAKLLSALAFSAPALTQQQRDGTLSLYQSGKVHRALALSLVTGKNWVSGSRPSAQAAEEASLEDCELLAGGPCVLIAVDDSVRVTSVNDLVPRPMPRVHYSGAFDPAQIPNVTQEVRDRADVAGYTKAAAAKAAAFHPYSGIFTVAGVADQHAAEEQALAACNADPKSNRNATCYLYASDAQVVLERRSKVAISPAVSGSSPPVQTVTAPAANATPVSIHDSFVKQLAAALPALPAAQRESFATDYDGFAQHKAVALHMKSSGMMRVMARASAELAELGVLEICQAFYGDPCVLFAVDQTLYGGSEGALAARDMPHNSYAGIFDPARIPAVLPVVRTRADVQGYAAAAGPKAAALHPLGQIYLVTGATNLHQAEVDALAACNADKAQHNAQGPCVLYASGNQVVFPKRLQLPLTPAAAATPVTVPAIKPPPVTPDRSEATRTTLLALLGASAGGSSVVTRDSLEAAVRNFASSSKDHKALAVSFSDPTKLQGIYQRTGQTAEEAQTITLEACQIATGAPCALAAIDNDVFGTVAKWNVQDMPRVRYAGLYSTDLPAVTSAQRQQIDVDGYSRAPAPKAMALSPDGKVGVASGGTSQGQAELQALANCGKDCYLYAAGSWIVLPQRLKTYRPYATTLGPVIAYTSGNQDDVTKGVDYAKQSGPKALAILPDTGAIYRGFGTSSAAAERIALEGCGLLYNKPCTPLARDDQLLTTDPTRAPRPETPRLTYQGPYRPEMVPIFENPPKVANEYLRMREPKAMAIQPFGAKIVAETGATLAEAEAKALAKCTDPDSAFPCLIYAANNQTILPQRRTEPQP
jgi:uncharacterized caspase-like protein